MTHYLNLSRRGFLATLANNLGFLTVYPQLTEIKPKFKLGDHVSWKLKTEDLTNNQYEILYQGIISGIIWDCTEISNEFNGQWCYFVCYQENGSIFKDFLVESELNFALA